jgi:hypothetical protein
MHERTNIPDRIVKPFSAEPLDAADRIEIHELVTRVYLVEDTRDYDAIHQICTEDFVQIHPAGNTEGLDAFVAFLQKFSVGFDGKRHHALNIVTRRVGDNEAEAASYLISIELFNTQGREDPSLPQIIGHAVVIDSLRKTDGQWRIYQRVYDQFAVNSTFMPDVAERERWGREASENR